MSSDVLQTIVAFDVGERRIGVAVANTIAQIASPLTTLTNDETIFAQIASLLAEQQATMVVLGLPRGLEGQETAQTHTVQQFAGELKQHIHVPLYWQDEALTSRQAETELAARGKGFARGDVDALAATYILEDFLHEQLPGVTQ